MLCCVSGTGSWWCSTLPVRSLCSLFGRVDCALFPLPSKFPAHPCVVLFCAVFVFVQEYYSRIMKKLKEVGATSDRTNFYV